MDVFEQATGAGAEFRVCGRSVRCGVDRRAGRPPAHAAGRRGRRSDAGRRPPRLAGRKERETLQALARARPPLRVCRSSSNLRSSAGRGSRRARRRHLPGLRGAQPLCEPPRAPPDRGRRRPDARGGDPVAALDRAHRRACWPCSRPAPRMSRSIRTIRRNGASTCCAMRASGSFSAPMRSPANSEARAAGDTRRSATRWRQRDEDADGSRGAPRLGADNLAYLIYTSGTTGGPKAVLQRHRTLANLVDAQCRCQAARRCWTALPRAVRRARLRLSRSRKLATALAHRQRAGRDRQDDRMDPDACSTLLARERIGRLFLPPAMLPRWPTRTASRAALDLSEVIVAGDALRIEPRSPRWQERAARVHADQPLRTERNHVVDLPPGAPNGAGALPSDRPARSPARASTCSTRHWRPVADRASPASCASAAPGVARGYLDRPELTAERFVPDPFGAPGARLYRTGDLVRWRPTARSSSSGRIDHQVKIRGYRIELGRNRGGAERGIPACASRGGRCARGRAGENRLVAYVVTARRPASTPAELRSHLRQTLPDYMVPAAFVTLDALPLNRNGKLDRARAARARLVRDPAQRAHDAARARPRKRSAADLARVARRRAHRRPRQLLRARRPLAARRAAGRARPAADWASRSPCDSLPEAPTIAELAAVLDEARPIAPWSGRCCGARRRLRTIPADRRATGLLARPQRRIRPGQRRHAQLHRAAGPGPGRRAAGGGMERTHHASPDAAHGADVRWPAAHAAGRAALPDRTSRRRAGPAQLRERMSHQLFSGCDWPLFETGRHAARRQAQRSACEHRRIALDASSAIQLGEELITFTSGRSSRCRRSRFHLPRSTCCRNAPCATRR